MSLVQALEKVVEQGQAEGPDIQMFRSFVAGRVTKADVFAEYRRQYFAAYSEKISAFMRGTFLACQKMGFDEWIKAGWAHEDFRRADELLGLASLSNEKLDRKTEAFLSFMIFGRSGIDCAFYQECSEGGDKKRVIYQEAKLKWQGNRSNYWTW